MAFLEISHLTRDYGGGRGVFDLSFSVAEGEVFGFLGPNGAGKTTTIRHLMGFLRPRQGACRIGGRDCWRQAAEIQRDLGYIPGELALFDSMRGRDYLAFLARYRGVSDTRRMQDLLDRFDLDPAGRIKKMSKGTKQKLGIVAAFFHDPAVLILDEPTSGLDPLMQSRFVSLLREEKARGKTILLSSHMFEEVDRTCDRIGIIRQGRLAALDTAEALRARHVRRYTVTLPDAAAAAAFARDFGGAQDPAAPCRVTVSARQTLEEIFLDYYGKGGEAT